MDLPISLQCPKCRTAMETPRRCAACATDFPTASDIPVLIDFENSICRKSDFEDADLVAVQADATAAGKLLHRLTFGISDSTGENIARFAELVAVSDGGRVLVIGGGTEGVGTEALDRQPGLTVVTTDIYPAAGVNIICDGHSLPFPDESFDGVLIQAVLEHVLDPARVVAEIERVLRPDGLVYAETPFLQHVHMGAYDFTRFTRSGHRWLFRRFTEVDSGTVLGPGVALLWSLNHFLTGAIGRKAAALLTAPFGWVRLLERRLRPQALADGASALFFLGQKRDPGLGPSAMRDYYEAQR